MRQVKRVASGLVLLLGLGTGAVDVAAQSWQGSLALGVEVQNDQKQPVPGARVVLEFAEVEPYDGPEPATTDASGQAAFYGLAEGLWRVQVEREGYSRYLAVVRLDAQKKKVVVTAGPLRDATAPPLTVDYSKAEARRVAPRVEERRDRDRDRRAERRRTPRDEPTEEPRPEAEPERRVEPEPAPPAPEPEPEARAEPAEPAPAEAEPMPAPQEPTEPAPAEPEPREPPEPEAPRAEPETERPSEPESQREPGAYEVAPAPAPEPEPAAPEPAPAPEMQTPPPEAPPEPEAQPTLPPSPMRSTANGTCSDCKPGEAAVSARFRAASPAAGSTSCPPDLDDRIREAIEALAAAPTPEADDYVGPLVDEGRVLPWAEPAAVAEAQRLLEPWVTPTSACQVALVVLSPDVKFTGYRYQAADAQAGGDCLAGQECPIGDARWPEHPRIEKTDAGTFVFSTFENRSSGWERRGEMTVYFEP